MSKRRSKTDYRGPRVCIFLPARAPLNYVRLPPPPPTSSPAPYARHTTAFPCLRDALAASPEMYLPKSASVEAKKKKTRFMCGIKTIRRRRRPGDDGVRRTRTRTGQANTIRFLVYFLHGIVFPKVASVLPRRACPLRCQPTSRPWSRTARRPPRRWWGPRCAPCTASPAPEGRTRRPPESSTPRPAGRRSGSPW